MKQGYGEMFLFIVHVSSSRRLLEPSSAENKNIKILQKHVKSIQQFKTSLIWVLPRNNFLDIDRSFQSLVPEVFML